MMPDIEYSKSLLPSSLTLPISDKTLDNLIDAQSLKLRLMKDVPSEECGSGAMDMVILAALLELKEKREEK